MTMCSRVRVVGASVRSFSVAGWVRCRGGCETRCYCADPDADCFCEESVYRQCRRERTVLQRTHVQRWGRAGLRFVLREYEGEGKI